MKKKLILTILFASLMLLVCILTIFMYHKKVSYYKQDMANLIGKDQYLIESINKERVNFYTLNNSETNNGFFILEEYMNTLGYKYDPTSQLGATYYFKKTNELHDVSCEQDVFKNYTQWSIYFK